MRIENRFPYQLTEQVIDVTAETILPDGTRAKKVLSYSLYDHSFAAKWMQHFRKVAEANCAPRNGGDIYGHRFVTREGLVRDFEHAIGIASKEYPDYQWKVKPHLGLTQEELNVLHRDFEILIERHKSIPNHSDSVRLAIDDINLTVHRFESILHDGDGSHVQLHFDEFWHCTEFDSTDYQFFSPNFYFGHLYLTYGITGVPAFSAFYSRPADPPRLQDVFTNGVVLHFGDDSVFQQYEEAENWLQSTYGWSLKDPRMSFGLIPLGVLTTEFDNFSEFKKSFANVKSFSKVAMRTEAPIENPKPEVAPNWPYGHVIEDHFRSSPYLRLPLDFDHEACLQEAIALLDRFVVHRNYDQTTNTGGQWKSLALQAVDGVSGKTEYHTSYGASEKSYALTEIVELCPKTMKLVNALTDIEQCQRVRFMLLEPGAEIKVHSDMPNRDIGYSMNIALNMPKGCEFWNELNPDGSMNRFSETLPISAGDLMIVNVARYHRVVNNSNVPRIHLIINGPLRIANDQLVAEANRLRGADLRASVHKLITREAFCSREWEARAPILREKLEVVGLLDNTLPEFIEILVTNRELADAAVEKFSRENATQGSIWPLRHRVVDVTQLDQALASLENRVEFAVILAAGTFAEDILAFTIEIQRQCADLEKAQAMISGHIMNWKKQEPFIPFLHEQFVVVNMQMWRELGRPSFGTLYSPASTEFPAYEASDENIHDDYTPLWLKPGVGQPQSGKAWWGTNLLRTSLENGKTVLNVSQALRKTKSYAYPDVPGSRQLQNVRDVINQRVENTKNRVYFFNNEVGTVAKIPDFKPNTLVSLSAGFKTYSLLQQYFSETPPEKTIIYDYSENSLKFAEGLLAERSFDGIVDYVFKFSQQIRQGFPSRDKVANYLNVLLENEFSSDANVLCERIRHLAEQKNVEFVQVDVVNKPEPLIEKLAPEDRVLLWHSNIWRSNVLYYLMNQNECSNNYHSFGSKIAKRLNGSLHARHFPYESLVSSTDGQVLAFLADAGREEDKSAE